MIHVYDQEIVDKVMVLEFEKNQEPLEIERAINHKISEMDFPKILGITSSQKNDGRTMVLIHHLGRKEG